MATITDDKAIFTAINVFQVTAKDQHRLVENLYTFIDTYVKPKRGFLSASVHRSEDGLRVINYAQWESREAWLAMERDLDASRAMQEQFKIARNADFHIYEVSFVIEPR